MSQSNIQCLLSGIALFIGAIVFNVIRNHKIILDKGTVKHTKEWFVKAASCTPCIIAFALSSNFIWVVALIVSGVMVAANFWMDFDGFLSKVRGHNFFFPGSIDEDDPNSDKFLHSIPIWLGATIKVLLAIGSVYLYIIGLQK